MNPIELQEKVTSIKGDLLDAGLSTEEIDMTMKQVEDTVYEELIDKIISGLDESHYKQLDDLMREGKSAHEIVEALPVSEDWFNTMFFEKLVSYAANIKGNTLLLRQTLKTI